MTRPATNGDSANELPPALEEQLFAIWLDQPDERRIPALELLCEQHPAHAKALRKLVRRIDHSDNVMAGIRPYAPTDTAPQSIGPYAIERMIGRGGFGVVYQAAQTTPVKRTVAIKLLHVGRLGSQGIARFATEQQTLAVMDHPSIARVFDAGTTEHGQPYFVMEFVDGIPITDYCTRHRTSLDDRLRIFLEICDAIDHAHQKGAVHRDLKPANVLVSTVGSKPLPRVIDFGIAKILSEHGGEHQASTNEARMLGTPEYMSPEQARGEPISVRTDVYSMGVLLYELFVGDLPFPREKLREANLLEVARIISESEPQSLGSALSEMSAERVAELAAACATTSTRLRAELRSDVAWIIIKCLEKEPARRYGSVSELRGDLLRFLNHQAVAARPAKISYLARRFVRRHRVGVGVAVFATLACLAGVVGLAWTLVTVDDARQREAEQRMVAEMHGYAAHVGAAKLAFDAGAIGNAHRHLDEAAVSRRGWEWRHVHALCDGGDPRFPCGSSPIGLRWLTNERLLLGGRAELGESAHAGIDLWDVNNRSAVRTIACGELRAIWADPELGELVTCSDNGIELWRIDEGARLATIAKPYGRDDHVKMVGDAERRLVAFGGPDGLVWMVDLDGDRRAHKFADLEAPVRSLAFATRSGWLLAGGKTIRGFALADGASVFEVEQWAEHMQLNHQETTVFATERTEIHAIDLATGARTLKMETPLNVASMAISNDDKTLHVVGGWADGFVVSLDLVTGAVKKRLHGHERGVNSVAISPDGERLATASSDRTLRVWAEEPPRAGHADAGFDARSLSRSPDGQRLASAGLRGTWRVWRAEDMRLEASGKFDAPFYACCLLEDRLYAIGRRLHILDLETGEDLGAAVDRAIASPTWTRENGVARELLVDPGEQWLAAMSYDRLMIWTMPLDSPPRVIEAPYNIHCLALDPITRNVAVGCADGLVRLFSPQTGAVVQTIDGLGPTSREAVDAGATGELPIYRLAFHGTRIASACADGRVRVRDRASGAATMTLRGHEVIATGVAFSPDGTRIVSSGGDGYVRIWEAESGIDLLPLRGRAGVAHDAGFSSDGSTIVTRYQEWGQPSDVYWWSAPKPGRLMGR